MIFTKLFMWVILTYGATQIIVESALFQSFRDAVERRSDFFGRLVTCMLCAGVWVSAITSVVVWSPAVATFDSDSNMIFTIAGICHRTVMLWADAMIGSVFVWFLHLIDGKLS